MSALPDMPSSEAVKDLPFSLWTFTEVAAQRERRGRPLPWPFAAELARIQVELAWERERRISLEGDKQNLEAELSVLKRRKRSHRVPVSPW